MTLPKNALTTNPPARFARRVYRSHIRPVPRDLRIALRTAGPMDRSNVPGFLLIGAQKAGTTGLYEALATLPGVGSPSAKEVHYFDQKVLRPSSWYFAHFWGSHGLLWGEASPEYLDTPDVPTRVQALLPDVKLIVSLRDPVARAVSHYHHSVDFGYEHRTLEAAVADELRLEAAGAWDSTMDRMRFGYLARSRYAGSLASWLELVSHDRLLVVVAEERPARRTVPQALTSRVEPARPTRAAMVPPGRVVDSAAAAAGLVAPRVPDRPQQPAPEAPEEPDRRPVAAEQTGAATAEPVTRAQPLVAADPAGAARPLARPTVDWVRPGRAPSPSPRLIPMSSRAATPRRSLLPPRTRSRPP